MCAQSPPLASRAGILYPLTVSHDYLGRGPARILLLWVCATVRLLPFPAEAQAPAAITVVATPALRPTAVLLSHVGFTVAVDTAAGGLVLRDLSVPPVTFAGTLRIEGLTPGARAPERAGFADSVRFSPDGGVTLLIADAGSRGTILVEPIGSRAASGGRLAISAANWPLARVMVATLDPADLHETLFRSVGYGVRDRIRVDDRRGLAFLSDSTARGTVVAIGLGRGTRGRIQTDVTSIVVERRFGVETGRERRQVGKLLIILEPARDEEGRARAELVFGVGAGEEEAAAQAAAAAAEQPVVRAPASLGISVPSAELSLALSHVLGSARAMLDFDRLGGVRAIPAGASDPVARGREGFYGALVAAQLGEADAVCGQYVLMKRAAPARGLPRTAVAMRLGAQGRYLWAEEPRGELGGDGLPYHLLTGYACHLATRDSVWLASELEALRALGRMLVESDRDGDGLIEARSDGTWAGLSPLASDTSYASEDPYVNAVAAAALDRLAELEEAAGGPGAGRATPWPAAARRIREALPLLWRLENEWFAFHALPDNSRSWDRPHLMAVDALAWGQVANQDQLSAAVAQLSRPRWWNAGTASFLPVPAGTDWPAADPGAVLSTIPALDFRALSALLQHGGAEGRRTAFQRLHQKAVRLVQVSYGRPGPREGANGLSMATAGALLDLVLGGLFGVEERLDVIQIAPRLGGIADDQEWRLSGWRVLGDTLALSYRPADRAATIRLTAARRRRLGLRFPWLTESSCVSVRRGAGAPEQLTLVALADGAFYVDVRAGFDPAELRVTGAPCGPA
jgi:hypothetical protein